jgi:hypothetical protein
MIPLQGAADTLVLSASMAAPDTAKRTPMGIPLFVIGRAPLPEQLHAHVNPLAASGTVASDWRAC